MKGVYILKIFLPEDRRIIIGSLGPIDFKKGYYAYAGSAMGGLEQRVGRHLRKDKKLHWHIDYLLANAEIKKVFVRETDRKSDECMTAAKLGRHDGVPVGGFGCSDCRCKSHLFHFKKSFKVPVSNYGFTNI